MPGRSGDHVVDLDIGLHVDLEAECVERPGVLPAGRPGAQLRLGVVRVADLGVQVTREQYRLSEFERQRQVGGGHCRRPFYY